MSSLSTNTSRAYFSINRRLHAAWEWPLNYIGRWMLLMAGAKYGENLRLHGLPILSMQPHSRIEIGSNCRFRSTSFGNAIGVNHAVVLRTLGEGALLKIGDSVGMSGGAICAVGSVLIGNRVLIGANAVISDSDFHSLDPQIRAEGGDHMEFRPVVIEDDVWLGADVYIGKGVTIGRSSVVGAKSVVTRNVPPNSIVAGNPAKLVRVLPFATQGLLNVTAQ